jgi:hypothetical protein
MKTNICPNFPKLWLGLFSLSFSFFINVHSLAAQSRWSNSPQDNNAIAVLPSGQLTPVAARDGQDGAIIVWVDNRSSHFDLYGQRIDVAGDLQWNDGGAPLITAPNSQESPAIAEAPAGGFFLAWQDNRLIFAQREISAQRFDGDGAPLWAQDARAHIGNNGSPNIFLDNSGNLFTTAYTSIIANQAASVQFLDPETGATQFKPLQKFFDQDSDALETDLPPAAAAALNGGVLAAWADGRSDTTLQALGVLSTGEAWAPGQITISEDIKPRTFPAIVSDGSDGVIIVWIEPAVVGGNDDLIKATRLNANGGEVWTPGIREIISSSGQKRRLRIASDSQNGAFIIWETRVEPNWRLYAQRIFNDGQSWNADAAVSVISSNQTNGRVINNRKGDAIVIWQDDRNLTSGVDLYAQRISNSGAQVWPPEGVAISTASGAQQNATAVDDGFGGAIIAWEDSRNGNPDIFAQRVSPNGVLGEFRTITVIAPAQGDNWEIGSQRNIRWSASAEIDSVKIELSRNGGLNFETIFEKVANANPENTSTYTVAGDPAGNAQVRITAVNADFIVALSKTFSITAQQGPSLSPPLQIQNAAVGENLQVTASATDISGVKTVTLNYKAGGARNFTAVNMAPGVAADEFRGAIPGSAVTERGVEYFVAATDNIDAVSNSDTFFVTVNFGAGVQTREVRRGSSQNAYRMFSAPNILDDPDALNIFAASNFGAYDTTSWRLFQFRGNGYVEFDSTSNANTFQFTPGQAYWVISARDRTINFGAGQSQRSDRNAAVNLPRGWAQLGNPFAFAVEWDAVLAASGLTEESVRQPFVYDGSGFLPATTIDPYQGYFVFNNTTAALTLRFPPVEAAAAAAAVKAPAIAGAEWQVQLIGECQQARDPFNLVGIHSAAAQEWDRFDYPEPPPIGDYISIYFPRNDWQQYPNIYTTDFRKEMGAGQIWIFDVHSNIAGAEARVRAEGLATLPQHLEIWLIDEKLSLKQDLRLNNQFGFPTGERGVIKSLKLVIGSGDFLAHELADGAFIPENFELAQNFPNPFNPTTAIRYGLPTAAKVTLKIYDVLGREVITLINNENKQPGFHLVTWNGRDKNGNGVASGLYIYRIAADHFVQSKKMLIVK